MTYQLKSPLEFTSGDVQEKLEAAIALQSVDESFAKEVEVLSAAVPRRIPLSQVIIKLGASWIPTKYYEAFCDRVLSINAKIFYSKLTHTWDIRATNLTNSDNRNWGWTIESYEHDYLKVSTYLAVGRAMHTGLFTLALNQSVPCVRVKADRYSVTFTHPEYTRQAIARQNQLKRRFEAWCREDSDRAWELEEIYNAKMNRTVLADWTGVGAKHLHPSNSKVLAATGMSALWIERLRNYQLDCIWRFAHQGGLIALEVGLGKTAVACAVTMLRKHYSLCTKAAIVVQKATLNQFYYTMLEMFPRAKVLCVSPEDLVLDRRQNYLAKIAYLNWDLVIMTHDCFKTIPLNVQTEIEYERQSLARIRKETDRLYGMGESVYPVGGVKPNEVLKKLVSLKDKTQQTIEELEHPELQARGICWENLGIDLLIVDEAQRFKNNMVKTALASKISGLSVRPSGRARDFDLKSWYLRKTFGNSTSIAMTGSPEPTNSILGVYVFQSYFQPEELEKRGIDHFDAWVSNFGEIKSQPEPKVDGKWRMTERLTDFINVAELACMWFSCVHFKRYKDVVDDFSDRDKRPEPEYITVNNKMSQFQIDKISEIANRYQKLKAGEPLLFPSLNEHGYLLRRNGSRIRHPVTKELLKAKDLGTAMSLDLGVEVRVDNFLSLSGDSRKLSIAPQLLDPKLPVDSNSKLVTLANNVAKIYAKTARQKLTQVVFLDVGTPGGNSKFGIYQWLKDYWTSKNITSQKIAFIQDCKTDAARQELFLALDSGEVRILIASTESGGIGVNIQKRLYAIHHFDLPYRPDEMEQREGRGIRLGNTNKTIKIYRYVTEGSKGAHGADTVILQFLQNKQLVRDRFMNGDPTLRRISENDSAAELYMMLKAESTGDERIVRYTEVEVELEEATAELSLARAELARIDGNRSGSILALNRLIKKYTEDNRKYTKEIDLVSPYLKKDAFSFCFDGGELVIGSTESQLPETKSLDIEQPYWIRNLIELYGNYTEQPYLNLFVEHRAISYVTKRIIAQMMEYDYSLNARGNRAKNRDRFYEIGCFQGLKLFFVPLGNGSFSLWLEGHEEWRISFRKTPERLWEQMQKGLETILSARSNSDRRLANVESERDKLTDRRVEVGRQVELATQKVERLAAEKTELQGVLDIE